ncbi:extracellular solute-binding protein [Paenibacillaceae bacterium]|nr:extracellular solute-binding protein [Paenibacillaceae bacterium]
MMPQKRLRSLISLALCAILLVLSACSNGGNTQGGNTSGKNAPVSNNNGAAPGAGADPFADKMTLNVYNAGSWAGGVPFAPREEDVHRQLLENAVNIDLQMTVPQAGEDITKLNTLLASGDIPDLIFFNDRSQAIQYYNDGMVAPLDDYLNDYPRLMDHFTEDQWAALKYQGSTIGTPGLELVSGIAGWWIRNDWLQNLNLSVPTTTDELFEVMKAFTFDDPDQNGKNDTYGFVGGVPKDGDISNTLVQGLGLNAIMWLFGVNPHKVDVENGQLVNHNTDPRMKEAVSYINRMVTEKVIDPDWVTISDAAQRGEKIEKGKVGIVVNDWRMMDDPTKLYEVSGEKPDWISIPPVKGPSGEQILGELAFQNNLWAVSTLAAKDPEKVKRILAMLEFWYTDEESYPTFSYGDKDIFWEYNDKNEVVRLSPEKEVVDAMKHTIHYKLPRRADDAAYYNFKQPELTGGVHQTNIQHSISPKPSVFLVPEESDSLYQDRKKYVNEMLLRFIYGREPIENWDTYVQTLEKTYQLKSYEDNVLKQLTEQGLVE